MAEATQPTPQNDPIVKAAAEALGKYGAQSEKKPYGAMVVVDEAGKEVNHAVFQTRDDYEKFIETGGKELAVGEGQRAELALYNTNGTLRQLRGADKFGPEAHKAEMEKAAADLAQGKNFEAGIKKIFTDAKENEKPGAVVAIMGEDGSIVASQSFKTEQEATAFIKSGKKLQKDGKDIEVGDKQSLVAVGLDKNGAMKAAIGGHKGADAYKEMAADIEAAEKEAAEKGKKFDWGQMMQKAMESGNMGMMILCAIVALVSSRHGEEPEVGQTPQEQQAGQAAPRPLNIGLDVPGLSKGLAAAGVSMEAYDAAPGGQEKLTAAAGMSTEEMAKLVADKAGIPEDQLTALTAAMKAGEQVSGDTKTVNVDIDHFIPPATPAQAASTGKGGGLNIG